MLTAEFLKLKRSATWIIALVLPLMAVGTGALNTHNNPGQLDGWASFTSQVVLFYGMLFFSMAVSILAATTWRHEHRGTNWNLLLTNTASPARLVIAKTAAVTAMVAVMQVMLVVATWFVGELVLTLPGTVPTSFVVTSLLGILAAGPLVALQSLLSMVLKSFAAPVGLCLLGCVVGLGVNYSAGLRPLSAWVPQGLVMRMLNLGSSAVSGMGSATATSLAGLLLPAAVVTVAITAASAWWLTHVKTR